MKTISSILFAVLAASAAGAGAQGMSSVPAASASSASGKSALPLVDAEVRKLDAAKGTIVLKHKDIPNIGMMAMTMQFDVADKKLLKNIKPGDKVRFQADMVRGKATVTGLQKAS